MNVNELTYNNLFSANHRTRMIQRYGYTGGMGISVEDLMWNWLRESLETPVYPEDHDCTMALDGYCAGCEAIAEFLDQ